MKSRKTRQILLLFTFAVFILVVSVMSHLQIALIADKFLAKSEVKPLLFSEWQGDLSGGQVQLALDTPQGAMAIGRVNWRNSWLDWLLLNPQMQSSLRASQSHLKIDGGYDVLGNQLTVILRDSVLVSDDLKPFWKLNRDYGRWLNGVEGRLQNIDLQADWSNQQQWFTQLSGTAQLVKLQFMGEEFPPIELNISQQQNTIKLQFSAQQNWTLQGEVTLEPRFADNKLKTINYQGSIQVQAESAEQLPNWASLMRAQGDKAAITKLQGQLDIN